MAKILVLNGPNLSLLGQRNPQMYGATTLSDIESALSKQLAEQGYEAVCIQSNAEHILIDALQEQRGTSVGAIVNPGALMIAGWSLRDALEDYPHPWVEIHISNIFARESFRQQSILSPLASGFITGLGVDGYSLAAQALLKIIKENIV